jgi:alpha-beta hydrolase superfamily lysophospholipase
MRHQRIYFIPGRGENLDAGLGRLIASMGYAVHGRGIVSEFARLRFAEQLALIRSDLQPAFWRAEAVLIGHSYGAYLLLQTLSEMDPFPGEILLVSPVLGAAVARNGFFGSRPPRAEKLVKLAESSAFPAPRYLEIHTGADDNGCDPRLAAHFASLVGNTKLSIVADAGHQLGEEYLRDILRRFLSVDSAP